MDIVDRQYLLLRTLQRLEESLLDQGFEEGSLEVMDCRVAVTSADEVLGEIVRTRAAQAQRQALETLAPGCGYLELSTVEH